jgi:UMF1 family MFS transporter
MAIIDARRSRLATRAWALWGWAEHSYPTIIQTFIFATYITSSAFGSNTDALTAQLGNATWIAGLIVALVAPVIGRRSDRSGRRKFWLLVNSAILIALMFASYFVKPDPSYLMFGLVLYGVGAVIQEIAMVNYYAMLKQLSTPAKMARLSGFAWGLGYLGGIAMLLIALVGFYLPAHPWFGISTDNAENIRFMFLLSGLWMLIFSIPLAIWVPELPRDESVAKVSFIQSYRDLFAQIRRLAKQSPDALRFLIASAIYRDGLAGVFTFGAVLGSVAFGFSHNMVIYFGIAASVVAGIGAVIGGLIDDKIGTKRTIMVALTGLVIVGLGIFVLAGVGSITYWVGGLLLCLFVGPAQASSRTFVARLSPKGREGEIFGLYQTSGEAMSFIAPLLWSITVSAAISAKVANPTVWGILAIVLVLAVGLALLIRVHPNPGEVQHD